MQMKMANVSLEAGKIVDALARVSYFMEENNCINRIQDRAMRIAYWDYQSTFEELLVKSKTVK